MADNYAEPPEEDVGQDFIENISEPEVIEQFDLGTLLSKNINVGKKFEPSCPVCSSPYRDDLEKEYVETKDYKKCAKSISDKSGKEITKGQVENHLKFHLSKDVRNLQQKEYVDRIKLYNDQSMTTMDKISMSFSIILEKIMAINSVVPAEGESLAKVENIKATQTVRLMSALTNLLKLQASIMGEMEENGDLIMIPYNDFMNIINDCFRQAETKGEKDIVQKILDGFKFINRKMQ